ncbi:Aldo/keto reductase [Lasiodiplodia theobromae]|uniref:Aflatoxin B1 aldehyde reductase member 3 n=1 Tax=Lasiodiplodia theobromae TaxID=45133 RepID=A0A5N5DK81_9PEZI|nr:Aldo/keto reductase [Lasiodiplodia theobromae]KAB2578318.1 Aflatoxin B1 aldehyde reductase member 3 [Lasiodiplodia theobromae]KAF4544763.1 Aldo/keto reductase [Lasiodiplodia theobromae]KAF9637865.1 Aldo/keto reductase [Lasiodiplodia theobromae]
MSAGKPAMKAVFGAMTIGIPGIEMTRVHTLEGTSKLLDILQAHGHNEVDSARVYGEGTSESYLGSVTPSWQERGIVMETKLYPNKGRGMSKAEYTHAPGDLRRGLLDSLKALKADKIDMWYLHGPDRSVPFEDTLREVNELHKEGYFARFGISNYQAWEVARICETCKQNGWIMPSVYQALYNAFHRKIEEELVPCLRYYGVALYVFNPLAGGFLTSRYQKDQTEFEDGERFDPKKWQGKLTRGRYWNDPMWEALEGLRPVAKKYGITEVQCALRWLAHHSALKKELGDAVIVGASGPHHLEDNLAALEQGPLPEEIVQALDAGWEKTRTLPLRFWH